MRADKPVLCVEAQGMRALQEDMRATGIIFKSPGETFDQMCLRIAREYGIEPSDARIELENFQ